ncbi:MAG: single-stranded DNA-binding protein, partial [Bradyrhizobium sp.]|nr:single-stranded DNA-binding protein [Bradyrhizobium sp.]
TDKDNIERYSTEVVLQGFNSTLTMLDGRSGAGGGGGNFGPDESGGDFGSGGPSSGPSGAAPRRVAAGAGARNSDMDDDIPF